MIKFAKNIVSNLLTKHLSFRLHNYNILEGNINIHHTADVQGARLYGNITISEGCKLFPGVFILARKSVEVGRYTSLNGPNFDIQNGCHPVKIGNFCSLARNVTIQEYNHNYKRVSTSFIQQKYFKTKDQEQVVSKGGIIIENDVWVGTQCVIFGWGSHLKWSCCSSQ